MQGVDRVEPEEEFVTVVSNDPCKHLVAFRIGWSLVVDKEVNADNCRVEVADDPESFGKECSIYPLLFVEYALIVGDNDDRGIDRKLATGGDDEVAKGVIVDGRLHYLKLGEITDEEGHQRHDERNPQELRGPQRTGKPEPIKDLPLPFAHT